MTDPLAALTEALAAAAQDHETSGIHGPLHCSLACGASLAAHPAMADLARKEYERGVTDERERLRRRASDIFGSVDPWKWPNGVRVLLAEPKPIAAPLEQERVR